MIIGHYAVGFASKRFAPRSSLGVLMAAPLLLDLLWTVFLTLRWASVRISPGGRAFSPLQFISYSYSHSLAIAALWATICSVLYFLLTRYRSGAIAIWIGVVSHWFMDLIVHPADLGLIPGSKLRFGFGLWNYPLLTILIESILFLLAAWMYLRVTRPKDKVGVYGCWALFVLMGISYLSVILGPPPPDLRMLMVVSYAMWIFVLWAWWVDRHREQRFV